MPPPEQRSSAQFFSLRLKFLLGFSLLYILAFAATVVIVSRTASRRVKEEIALDLENTLQLASLHIDGDRIEEIYNDLSDAPQCDIPQSDDGTTGYYPEDPRYWEHVNHLWDIHERDPRAYLYTYRKGTRPREMIFIGSFGALMEPRAGASFCYRFIATSTDDPYRGLEELTLHLDTYEDEFGTWVTGYQPITNAEGEVVAALGVDFKADELEAERQQILRPFLIAIGVNYLVLLVVGGLVANTLTVPLESLTLAIRRVADGDYSINLDDVTVPKPRDEISILVTAFRQMRAKRQAVERSLQEQRLLAETLATTAELLTSTLDLEEVLNRILEQVDFIVENHNASVLLRHNDSIIIFGLKTPHPDIEQERIEFDISNMGNLKQVAESGVPKIYAEDELPSHWNWINLKDRRSAIVVPIRFEEHILGFIAVSHNKKNHYTQENAERLLALAHQAAIAINNARLTEELRSLSRELVTSQEEERRRIAHDLHDAVGQTLHALHLNLSAISQGLSEPSSHNLHERLNDSRGLVAQLLEQVRELTFELRPTMLDDLGLVPTLRWLTHRFAERTAIATSFDVPYYGERLPPDVETNLFRITQEALTNISRHADARSVAVRLRWDDTRVDLRIHDDGKGFDVSHHLSASQNPGHLGLLGMRERVTRLNGQFNLTSEPQSGTTIEVHIPLSEASIATEDILP